MIKIIAAAVVLALATICFSVAALVSPTKAAECRSATAEKVLSDIKNLGGVILDTFNYDGTYGDTIVFYEIDGNIWMVGLKGECFQAGPTLIDAVLKKDTGTPA